MNNLKCNKLEGYIISGIKLIENSTKKLVENETRKFEAYIDILKNRMLEINEIEHINEILQEEIARITEQLSLRELEIESKEKKIFELEKEAEKEANNRIKIKKKYELELNKLIKEKECLMKELSDINSNLEKENNRKKEILDNNIDDNLNNKLIKKKSKKRCFNNISDENLFNDNIKDNTSVLKKGRLRRPQDEDNLEDKKKSIKDNEINDSDELLDNDDNPLKNILGKTNLGRLRAPLLRSRIVKAAEAANPDNDNLPELKSLEEISSNRKSKNRGSNKDDKKKISKKTSKLAKIAKIPQYDENILNSMRVIELKDICNKLQLEINNKARKSDLIQMILSFQNE